MAKLSAKEPSAETQQPANDPPTIIVTPRLGIASLITRYIYGLGVVLLAFGVMLLIRPNFFDRAVISTAQLALGGDRLFGILFCVSGICLILIRMLDGEEGGFLQWPQVARAFYKRFHISLPLDLWSQGLALAVTMGWLVLTVLSVVLKDGPIQPMLLWAWLVYMQAMGMQYSDLLKTESTRALAARRQLAAKIAAENGVGEESKHDAGA